MQQEAPLAYGREVSSSTLRRSLYLDSGDERLRVEPDGSVSYLHSTEFGKVLFGKGSAEAFKIQAGVVIQLRQRERRVRLSPGAIGFSSGPQEPVQTSQTLQPCGTDSKGYLRSATYTNRSESVLRLRVLTLHDPTALNFRLDTDPPSDIGVNAFNRGDHVVMDDVGDTTGVRVIGFTPRPTAIYLTRSKQKAIDFVASGEVPENTAGMSGAILILSQHDVEVPPGGSYGVTVASLYHRSSLESALSELRSGLASGEANGPGRSPTFRSSSPSVNFAYAWARASLGSIEREPISLERISAGFGLGLLRSDIFESDFAASKASQRRDGMLPHSTSERGGPMETSLFVINSCGYLGLKGDRRLARKWYPTLRKAGNALRKAATDGLIATPAGSPDGWRRRLGSGYPTGHVTEVNLIAARALSDLASLAGSLNKGAESAGFRDAGAKILETADERLRDIETGSVAVNLDPKGRLHLEATVDQAVALSYSMVGTKLGLSTVHRLQEKDFETGYGPRTVSQANALYYSPTYGEGQLGGCWTRGTLAVAILAYASGLPAVGSAMLEKVSALVHSDCEKMGGVPGEFPYWFDPEKRQMGSVGSDPVASSRFVEALLTGEAGLTISPEGPSYTVPAGSRLGWISLRGLRPGVEGALFAGRSPSRTLVVSSYGRTGGDGTIKLGRCESIEGPASLECTLFWDPSSLVLCVGNSSGAPSSGVLQVPTRGKPLATALFVDVEEFNQETWLWDKLDRRRLLEKLEFRVDLGPNAWTVYRVAEMSRPGER
jgi:hypothetical protein